MRKLPLILGLLVVVLLTIKEIDDFVVTNDGIHYFTSHPSRLVQVAAISIVVGGLALAISRLSPFARRRLTILTLSTFAAISSCILGVFTVALFSYSSMITEFGMWPLVVAALVSVSGAVSLLWFEFFSVLRRDENPVS